MNFHRATPAALREVLNAPGSNHPSDDTDLSSSEGGDSGEREAGEAILDFRCQFPGAGVSALTTNLVQAQHWSMKTASSLSNRLTATSRCHSLWVVPMGASPQQSGSVTSRTHAGWFFVNWDDSHAPHTEVWEW